MSISRVSGILRSRATQRSEPVSQVLRASNWLTEGQYVIHFLWDMRKFDDSIKAHLLVPQLVTAGYPIEILALGTLPHKSQRCPQACNGFSDVITGCASSILAGCLQSCSWVKGQGFAVRAGAITGGRDPWVENARSTLTTCISLRRVRAAVKFCRMPNRQKGE